MLADSRLLSTLLIAGDSVAGLDRGFDTFRRGGLGLAPVTDGTRRSEFKAEDAELGDKMLSGNLIVGTDNRA